MKPLLIGTRGSNLALRQTEEVLQKLKSLHPENEFVVKTIRTLGDKAKESPLDSLGVGVFVKELDEALLNGEIDIAVHSLKDIPPQVTPGLRIGAVCERMDPRDVLINKWGCGLHNLPHKSRIGTSSPRRAAQIKASRPDLKTLPIRGNIETRIEKALGKEYDAVLLAASGVLRLGFGEAISEYLPLDTFVPAPGQGALAVQSRHDDEHIKSMLTNINHVPTSNATTAEREFLARLGGGCQLPAAAYAHEDGLKLFMIAFLATSDLEKSFINNTVGYATHPERVATKAHQQLVKKMSGQATQI